MSKKDIRIRQKWQESVSKLEKTRTTNDVNILGKRFIVLPGVFNPKWMDSEVLAKNVIKEAQPGESVLDVGTGSGVQGIFAAYNGSNVIAVDINPKAIDCAIINSKRHKLNKLFRALKSNLFSKVHDRKFDLIIFNPPFRWFKAKNIAERASLDENYETLQRFLNEAKSHLTTKGRLLMIFSDSGDIGYFETLVKETGYKFKIIDRKTNNKTRWKYRVYKITV